MRIRRLFKDKFVELFSRLYDAKFDAQRFDAIVAKMEELSPSGFSAFAPRLPHGMCVAFEPIITKEPIACFEVEEYAGTDEYFLAFPAYGALYGYKVKETFDAAFSAEEEGSEKEDDEDD